MYLPSSVFHSFEKESLNFLHNEWLVVLIISGASLEITQYVFECLFPLCCGISGIPNLMRWGDLK